MSFPNTNTPRTVAIFPSIDSRTRPTTAGGMLSGLRVASYSGFPSQHHQNLNDINPPPYVVPHHRRNFTDTDQLTGGNAGSNGQYRRTFIEQGSYSTQVIRGNPYASPPHHRTFTADGQYCTPVVNGRIKRKEVERPGAFWEKTVDMTFAADPKRGLVVGFTWDDLVAAAFGPN